MKPIWNNKLNNIWNNKVNNNKNINYYLKLYTKLPTNLCVRRFTTWSWWCGKDCVGIGVEEGVVVGFGIEVALA